MPFEFGLRQTNHFIRNTEQGISHETQMKQTFMIRVQWELKKMIHYAL